MKIVRGMQCTEKNIIFTEALVNLNWLKPESALSSTKNNNNARQRAAIPPTNHSYPRMGVPVRPENLSSSTRRLGRGFFFITYPLTHTVRGGVLPLALILQWRQRVFFDRPGLEAISSIMPDHLSIPPYRRLRRGLMRHPRRRCFRGWA